MSNQDGFGIIYKHAWIYKAAMWLLYRTEYQKKYQLVADEVPAGSTVVDLCCGDSKIYPLLKEKGCKYIGLDINPAFVEWGKNKGVDVRLWDGDKMEIPQADVVCIQSSLYHFIPDEKKLLEKMMQAASNKIIIAEPVDNWTQIRNRMLHRVAIALTQVRGRNYVKRHSEQTIGELIREIPSERISRRRIARELIISIDMTKK